MTFLNPIAGIAAAAIALPLLVLLYFLKLRRRPVRVSSTLLWERAIKDLEANVPFRWLRLSWPLIIQLLALASLATAIARPALDTGGSAGGKVLVLIDRSASMSALDGGPPGAGVSRLDQAKQLAKDLVDSLRRSGRASEVMVAQFAASAQTLTPLTPNAGIAKEVIDAISPTDQPGDLGAALRLLSAFAQPGEEERVQDAPTVYVFSDGCNDSAGGRVVVSGMDVRHQRVGPDPGQTSSDAGPAWNNQGIVSISARRDYDDPVMVRLFVRVLNAADQPVSAVVRVQVGSEDMGVTTLALPAASTSPAGQFLPGEATATVVFPSTTGGALVASLPGGDLLAADDTGALVLAPPLRPRVVAVGPGGDTDAGVDGLIRSCLRAMSLGRLDLVDAAGAAGLAGSEALIDLVIYDRVKPTALPRVPSISFGAGLPIPGLTVRPMDNPQPTRVISWRRDHPLLRYVALETVVVDPPMLMRFDPPAREVRGVGGRPVSFLPLAEGADGPLIALLDDGGIRRVVIAFELERSNWGPTASFPVFLAGAVDYLTLRGESQSGRAFTTAEPVTVTPAPGARLVMLSGPREVAAAVSQNQTGEVSLGVLERAGLYRCRGCGTNQEAVAVNLASPAESAIRTRPALDLVGEAGKAAPAPGPARGEIWHWFVIVAAILLTIEWFMLAWRMRV